MLLFLMQAAQQAEQVPAAVPGLFDHIKTFVDTPAPYSPFSEYLAVLFLLWLLARRDQENKKDFSAEAQQVLEAKFKSGEIDRSVYEKYRQELSMRLKKE
ncbi:MAG TPA: hypothetical protein VF021_05110 [Longimicrobiales bacterium]